MKEPNFTPDIFEDIVKLINNIGIVNGYITHPSPNKLDAISYIESEDDKEFLKDLGIETDEISVRKIIELLNKFLSEFKWSYMIDKQIGEELRKIVPGFPAEYIMLNYFLCALSKNNTDALLYLEISRNLFKTSNFLHMLLSCIIKHDMADDLEVRKFLALFANAIEPVSAEAHTDKFGEEYKQRFETYRNELRKLS